ncbi:hypothetical protein PHMEG_00018997 [Phytophthora megakarya]|uniref:RxLR effector protein n=1 Tax=Phytophthora megakarya TaxID=4795 RepID=A0A225VUI9_9STRA|nr:hypothetical protein PHMEG_00018997 [Phytophthora megakarya]
MRSFYAIAAVVAMLSVSSHAVSTTNRRGQINIAGAASTDPVQSTETTPDINRLLRSGGDVEADGDDVSTETTPDINRLLRSGGDVEADGDDEARGFESYYKMWHKNGETSAAVKKDLNIAGLKYRYGKGSAKLLARDEYKKWKGYKEYLKTNPLD